MIHLHNRTNPFVKHDDTGRALPTLQRRAAHWERNDRPLSAQPAQHAPRRCFRRQWRHFRRLLWEPAIVPGMDEWTKKTPNPICRLFFKIDLLTDFAAMCLTDFIDWRKSYKVNGEPPFFLTLWTYLLSDLLPLPPSQTKCTGYTDSVCQGGRGWGVVL